MEDRTRVHVFVSGEVQGVNFRQAIADKANEQGVAGWVRNLPDGSVELEAEGNPGAVDEFLAWSRRGPIGARVDALDAEDIPAVGDEDFTIRH